MDVPLGRAAGNWLEVREAVDCLRGRQGGGPEDLERLVVECAAPLLAITGSAESLEEARRAARSCLGTGEPLRRWEAMIEAQGADQDAYRARLEEDSTAPVVLDVAAERAGFVTRCDARVVGQVVRDLGGGRFRKENRIDPAVGVDRLAKPGDELGHGAVLARVHARTREDAERAAEHLRSGFRISDLRAPSVPLIAEIVGGG
jgi:thymidine phosphorylase